MKKIKFLIVIAFFAAITILSSCIENEVAPEVTALRNAQLELIQAKVDVQLAETEVDLERAKLELQQAIDDHARYLAENNLQEAADYLLAYSDYMDDYYNAREDVYEQEAYIAGLYAAFEQNDYELAREMIQRDLDDQTEMLAIMEDILATMEAVAGDPGTAAEEIATALALIQELENENIQIEVEMQKFENDVLAPAWNAWKEADGGNSYYNNVSYPGYAIDPAELAALEAAYYDALEDYNDMEDPIDVNNDIIEAQYGLVWVLTDQIYNIDAEIESLLDVIETAKQDINFLENQLADEQIDEDELTAQIANEEAELERLNNERDAYLELANKYWELYQSALGD